MVKEGGRDWGVLSTCLTVRLSNDLFTVQYAVVVTVCLSVDFSFAVSLSVCRSLPDAFCMSVCKMSRKVKVSARQIEAVNKNEKGRSLLRKHVGRWYGTNFRTKTRYGMVQPVCQNGSCDDCNDNGRHNAWIVPH